MKKIVCRACAKEWFVEDSVVMEDIHVCPYCGENLWGKQESGRVDSLGMALYRVYKEKGSETIKNPKTLEKSLQEMAPGLGKVLRIFSNVLDGKLAADLAEACGKETYREGINALPDMQQKFTEEYGLSEEWSAKIFQEIQDAVMYSHDLGLPGEIQALVSVYRGVEVCTEGGKPIEECDFINIDNGLGRTGMQRGVQLIERDLQESKRWAEKPVFHLVKENGNGDMVYLSENGKVKRRKEKHLSKDIEQKICDVESWKDIIQIVENKSSIGEYFMGLNEKGRIVSVGLGGDVQSNIEKWTGIVQIAGNRSYVAGLQKEGHLMIVSTNISDSEVEESLKEWSAIVNIAMVENGVVGLHEDGSIVSNNPFFSTWDNIIDIVAVGEVVIGLREDGKIITTDNVPEDYQDIDLEEDGEIITTKSTPKNYQGLVSHTREHLPEIAAGEYYTVAVKDRTRSVLAVGYNNGVCDISRWRGIEKIAVGSHHIVALEFTGCVKASGENRDCRCEVSSWNHIIAVAAGNRHTVGLKSTGRVLAVGNNYYGQCNVNAWDNIKEIAAGANYTIGLCGDGTVVFTGNGNNGQERVAEWTKVEHIAAGLCHTVGLRKDGAVVAVGENHDGRCEVSAWKDVKEIAAGAEHTVGLCTDGTVVATGNPSYGRCKVSEWKDVVEIKAGIFYTMGLRSDGTVLIAGGIPRISDLMAAGF